LITDAQRLAAEVHRDNEGVKLPLVGGKIEKYLGGHLAEGIPATQRFTTDWIAEHSGH
jgi:hypothetical protein